MMAGLLYGVPVWSPPEEEGGFLLGDALLVKPVSVALALPWNVGRAATLWEAGFLPFETAWELVGFNACRRIMSSV